MARVEALAFPPQDPVNTILGEIDNLATIANYANAPTTSFQKIDIV